MKKISIIFILLIVFVQIGTSQNDTDSVFSAKEKKLIVGYKIAPPFVVENSGMLEGVSIELWETIARELGYSFEYKKYEQSEIQKMLKDIENGVINISINPTTVTSERINRVDFTQPFYMSSLAIAVRSDEGNQILTLISNIFSFNFWAAILFLLIVLLTFGIFIWLIEKRKNANQFRKGIKGVGDGVWWAAATMTTVGYGDLAPKSFAGRLFGIIWMFTAIIVISSLTGSIAASLTTKQSNSIINHVSDLNKFKVGTIKGTSSEEFLLRNKVSNFNNSFDSVKSALESVSQNEIDAFVYDFPVLNYYVSNNENLTGIKIIEKRFSVDYLSFSMKKGDPLLTDINRVLIAELEKISWLGVLNKYQLSGK